jgi:conjugal transfer/entry exclusion protein
VAINNIKQIFEQPLSDGMMIFCRHFSKSHHVAAITNTVTMQKALVETSEDRRHTLVSLHTSSQSYGVSLAASIADR